MASKMLFNMRTLDALRRSAQTAAWEKLGNRRPGSRVERIQSP